MTQATKGKVVKVHYTGRLKDGTVFDSSHEREALKFTIGQNRIIPGFEKAVVGMEPGQSTTVEIPMEKAFGPRQPDKTQEIDRSKFPADVHVGQQYQVDQGDSGPGVWTVIGVSEGSVTLDSNHPLAGHDLTFDIKLLDVV
jgi:peptidylprolyl isomerase